MLEHIYRVAFDLFLTKYLFSLENNICLNRRVWRYQSGHQNPYIEEEQTTQWSKENKQKDKQRSIKHTYKTKDRVTRTPLKTGGKLRFSGRVRSFCFKSGTSRVNLVTTPYHVSFHNKLNKCLKFDNVNELHISCLLFFDLFHFDLFLLVRLPEYKKPETFNSKLFVFDIFWQVKISLRYVFQLYTMY